MYVRLEPGPDQGKLTSSLILSQPSFLTLNGSRSIKETLDLDLAVFVTQLKPNENVYRSRIGLPFSRITPRLLLRLYLFL